MTHRWPLVRPTLFPPPHANPTPGIEPRRGRVIRFNLLSVVVFLLQHFALHDYRDAPIEELGLLEEFRGRSGSPVD
jgi:hypothetical protein